MGVTPPSGEMQATRATPSRESAATSKTETRSKFEEAMRRMREGGAHDHQLTGGEGMHPFEQSVLQLSPRSVKEERDGGDLAHGAGIAAPAQHSPVAEAMALSASPAEIAASHYEFQSRIGLPSQISGTETQLTMTDQRWLATHAAVRSDEAGGLSVEIQTRSDADADAEQQREALQSRLEARGHRITSIQFDRE